MNIRLAIEIDLYGKSLRTDGFSISHRFGRLSAIYALEIEKEIR
jgi:hypothetical protein